MSAELRTWVATVLAILLSFLTASAWWTRRTYPGFVRWTVANWLLVLALPLFILRSVAPDWISVVGANALFAVAAILLLEGIRQFRNSRPRVWQVYVAGGLAILAILLFDYVHPSVNERILAMSSFLAIIAFLCSITLLKVTPVERTRGMTFTGGMYALWASILIARAIYFQFAPPMSSLFDPSLINAAFLVATLLGAACCSVGFVLMTDERVMMDLKDAEGRAIRANQELVQAVNHANSMAQQATSADAAKSEFVAAMSHEIRNPLSGIMVITEVLLETDLTAEQREYLEALRKSVAGLLAITGDALDLSQIEADRLTIKSSAFDLRSVIEDVVKISEPISKRKGVELFINYPSSLPRLFVGDEGRVRQVILNLVGNAVKFTSTGDIKMVVECTARGARDVDLRVSVTDTGIGIPPEQIGSIFEKFGPAHTSTARTYGGTGMGLAISKKLIELMGGSIRVESQVGKGSTFWFTLPLAVEQGRGPASFQASS